MKISTADRPLTTEEVRSADLRARSVGAVFEVSFIRGSRGRLIPIRAVIKNPATKIDHDSE